VPDVETRRSFLSRSRILLLALLTGTGRVYFYSIHSKVGPWAGWIENKAGDVVAFFTKHGHIFRMKAG
jgi:hypothetical protein